MELIPRALSFEGAVNFRDLGGYPAADGRKVRYGMIYRGGSLSGLESYADWAKLQSLGLRYILDFRSSEEIKNSPDFIPEGARYKQISAMRYDDGTEIDYSPRGMARLERELTRAAKTQSAMDMFKAYYARMPFRNPAFQTLFRALDFLKEYGLTDRRLAALRDKYLDA